MVRLPEEQAYSVGTLTDDMSTPYKHHLKPLVYVHFCHRRPIILYLSRFVDTTRSEENACKSVRE